VNDDGGEYKLLKYNWIVASDMVMEYEIKGNDPLSAKVKSSYFYQF
jgi:hypothetical protein